ncbi:MIP family channel protein [Bacillus sp. 165]|uniref:MIP family channel protein n=1 Tax=Bacillus sp. 165 TaxID=1529117 RepID=UPI001ADC42E4|nr:MIP family channel protein [Bacillus sp. 165]MBO9129420.1 MIP family channel protein [Bacillus sp. 165]
MRKKLTAEFLGTYFLVFAGTGAVVINQITKSLTHIGIALTFGLVVTALIYTFGHISGAHFNPAVTIGFFLLGDTNKRDAIGYVIVQIAGAVLASMTMLMLFGNVGTLGATLPRGTELQSFGLEFILTFFLMLIILGSAVHGKAVKSFAGLAIGATVGLEAMFGGPISGASMNPARSIGPALISGHLEHLWIYIVATIVGAITATVVYKFMHE